MIYNYEYCSLLLAFGPIFFLIRHAYLFGPYCPSFLAINFEFHTTLPYSPSHPLMYRTPSSKNTHSITQNLRVCGLIMTEMLSINAERDDREVRRNHTVVFYVFLMLSSFSKIIIIINYPKNYYLYSCICR